LALPSHPQSTLCCIKGERNVKLRILTWSWPGLGASLECQQCAWLIFVRYTVWIQAVSLAHSDDDPGMLIFPWPTHMTIWPGTLMFRWPAHKRWPSTIMFRWYTLRCPRYPRFPLAHPQKITTLRSSFGTPTEDGPVTLMFRWHTHRRWPGTDMFRWHTHRWPRYAHVPLAQQQKMAPVRSCSVGTPTWPR
jgi:hypothetical protein